MSNFQENITEVKQEMAVRKPENDDNEEIRIAHCQASYNSKLDNCILYQVSWNHQKSADNKWQYKNHS